MYLIAVCTENQAVVGVDIIIDLDVGGIPNISSAADLLAEILQKCPVIAVMEFVTVPPKVEKSGISVGVVGMGSVGLDLEKLVCIVHQRGVFVVCSGHPGKPVSRQTEITVVPTQCP